jgi:hypothetical protein
MYLTTVESEAPDNAHHDHSTTSHKPFVMAVAVSNQFENEYRFPMPFMPLQQDFLKLITGSPAIAQF